MVHISLPEEAKLWLREAAGVRKGPSAPGLPGFLAKGGPLGGRFKGSAEMKVYIQMRLFTESVSPGHRTQENDVRQVVTQHREGA